MDIEELRARAIASMRKKKELHDKEEGELSSEEDSAMATTKPLIPSSLGSSSPRDLAGAQQSGKIPSTNKLLDTNGMALPAVSSTSAPSFGGSRKETDAFLSSLQAPRPLSRSPAGEEKDDNLVIRFSDGESDSDAEEQNLKRDQRQTDGLSRGNSSGTAANAPIAASLQTTASTSHQTPGMRNQMAVMQKQLAPICTTMSGSIQLRSMTSGVSGEGSSHRLSCSQKPIFGQKASGSEKHGVRPGAYGTKPSGSDLEKLRKQIATKENELKLQRHIRSGKSQESMSIPGGKLHAAEIAVSMTMSTAGQLPVNPPPSKLIEGASDKKMNQDPKVPKVPVQAFPVASLKTVNASSLQQQGRLTPNINLYHSCTKDSSINEGLTKESHRTGLKRPYEGGNLLGQKFLRSGINTNEKNIASTQQVRDSVHKPCLRVDKDVCSLNVSGSTAVAVLTPSTSSKRKRSEDYQQTSIQQAGEREENKKIRVGESYPESSNDVISVQGQSSAGQISFAWQEHGSIEAYENKSKSEYLHATSASAVQECEDSRLAKVRMGFEEIQEEDFNTVETAHIKNSGQNLKSVMKQMLADYKMDAKEGMDGIGIEPFIQGIGCGNKAYSNHLSPAETVCQSKTASETSGDVPSEGPESGLKNSAEMIDPSKAVVGWQGRRHPLCKASQTEIDIQHNSLEHGNISMQALMKEEELADKELEEAQEHRCRCEIEERLAWRAYRKAQGAVHDANQRCIYLHQKRELLSAQVRDLGMRDHSAKGTLGRDQQSREGWPVPQSILGHKDLNILTHGIHSLQDHLEVLKQTGYKLDEHGLDGADYAIMSSLQPSNQNDLYLSKNSIQSGKQSSISRVLISDLVPNSGKKLHTVDEIVNGGKILDSECPGMVADQGREPVSLDPEVSLAGEVSLGKESTFMTTEPLQRNPMDSSLQHPSSSLGLGEHKNLGLRRGDLVLDSVKNISIENEGNHGFISDSSTPPENFLDERKTFTIQRSCYEESNCLRSNSTHGIGSTSFALASNEVLNLERTVRMETNRINQAENGQKQLSSPIEPPNIINFQFSGRIKDTLFATGNTPSGSVVEACHGLKRHQFLSISDKDVEISMHNKAGGSGSKHGNLEKTTSKLLDKDLSDRAPLHQISAPECALNGLAKFSCTTSSKERMVSHAVSPADKSKEHITATSSAETSMESLHGQNYDLRESDIQFPGKHESFVCLPSQCDGRLQEASVEIVEATNVGYPKNLIGEDMHENGAGTCHSDDSFASNLECEMNNDKRFTNLSRLNYTTGTFEEINREKSHSGSDEGSPIENNNKVVWENSIEGHVTPSSLVRDMKCEQQKQLDFPVGEDVTGRCVTSRVSDIDDEEDMQGFAHACVLRHGAAQRILHNRESFTRRKIEELDKGCYDEAYNQSSESEFWMLSSKLKVVFNCKVLFSNSHGIFANASGKKTHPISQASPEYISKFQFYESPLDVLKPYKIYTNLIAANSVPINSNFWSYAIDPFRPLCKFEHRGKCNNEDCPWQHAKDYNLTPSQVLEQLNKYSKSDIDSSVADCKEVNSSESQEALICLEAAAKEAISRVSKIHCADTVGHSAVLWGLLHHRLNNYKLEVPIYRIGSHLIKADSPLAGSLIACSSQRFWKLGFCQFFSMPFAVQRLLPSDMPCLRSSAVRDWMLGNNNRLPTCLYTSSVLGKQDDKKKHLFRGPQDVECWLELAIDSMNFDSNIDKSDGRKKALCALSRALEVNPNSVALWVVYLHIFYRKEKVIGKDDMFYHAVQHNRGSYELWLLFINSRLQLDQRLEAYKSAITALCQKACTEEVHTKSISSYVLDLALQMLNFLCVTDHKHIAMSWIDGILYSSTGGFDKEHSELIQVSNLLTCLTKHDACIFWVCCTYLVLYGKLPAAVVARLEFEQKLPFDVDWHSSQFNEASKVHALKLIHTAVSNLSECLISDSSQLWQNDEDALLPMHALAVNHIKCVSALEGLASARSLSCQYRKLHPTCIEVILISSSIEAQYGANTAGRAVFEEALFNWPGGKPGIQCIWNQYFGYAMESEGLDFVKRLMNRWCNSTEQHKMQYGITPCSDAGGHMCSPSRNAVDKRGVEESKDKRKQDYNYLASTLGTTTHYFSASRDTDRRSWSQDAMFALLNLAIYKFLNNDPTEAQAAANKALKAALDDRDVEHCIREHAALAFFGALDGLEARKNGFDTRILRLLDKCFLESRLFPIAKTLSRTFSESIKKPKIRLFIDNLLGPIPVHCSLLNSLLETCYGPSLVPEDINTLKDLVDFVEGLLELAPANVKLALSVSRLIDRYISQSVSSLAALLWASSLLINSLYQSFPVAPESTWLEVGDFLGLLDVDAILVEFYQQALSVHPFSVTLWRSFHSFCHRSGNSAGVIEAAKQRGLIID